MGGPSFVYMGTTGSGKTTMLLGMYDIMRSGINGYSISANPGNAEEFDFLIEKMKQPTENRFPLGSDDYAEYNFGLFYHNDPVFEFSYIDYPGGDLKKPSLAEQAHLKEIVSKSPCLFICISAEEFLYGGKSRHSLGELFKRDLTKWNDSDEVIAERIKQKSCYMQDFIRSNFQGKKFTYAAVIITKHDLMSPFFSDVRIKNIMKLAFGDLMQSDDGEHYLAVFKVSLGKDISSNRNTGKYKPYNIHLPLLYGILWTMTGAVQMYSQGTANYEKNKKMLHTEEDYNSEIQKVKKKKENIFNKRSIAKSKNKIQMYESDLVNIP